MELPGGLFEHGTRRRDWAFRPVSGALEFAVTEVGETAPSMPAAVTRILTLALEQLAGDRPSEARVDSLCVGDRQFLMRELDRHLGYGGEWLQVRCGACGEGIDVLVDYAALPVQEGGEGFPFVDIERNAGRVRARLPVGADQHGLALQSASVARDWLLDRLVVEGELPDPPGQEVGSAVEAALEAIAPAIVLALSTTCPVCGASNEIPLDPYRVLTRSSDELLDEIHRIALHYHWSEAEILALPRERRQRYLRLLDRARGMLD